MKRYFMYLPLALAACLLPLSGCKHDDGMTTEQQARASRLDDIATKSGGDWEKVSAADREYLTKELSSGSEASAKMLLLAKSGKLKGGPGGAPGGPPTGAPPVAGGPAGNGTAGK